MNSPTLEALGGNDNLLESPTRLNLDGDTSPMIKPDDTSTERLLKDLENQYTQHHLSSTFATGDDEHGFDYHPYPNSEVSSEPRKAEIDINFFGR